MPRLTINQTNFTAGEISPRMIGRSDVARYQNGAEIIENAVVAVHGGLDRRYGQRYLAPAKYSGARKGRLIPYVFNTAQAYMLEFGHLYVRVFASNGAVVLNASLATLEVTSPYTEDQLFDITFRQLADTLLLFHPNLPTQRVQRLSSTLWYLVPVPWVIQPYAEIGFYPVDTVVASSTAIGPGVTFTTNLVVVPGAPTGVVATPLNGAANVAFIAPASDGGSPITGYTATSTPGGLVGTSTGGAIRIAGLTNGVAYTFTVAATNAVGNSPASAASLAVTPAVGLAMTSVAVSVAPVDKVFTSLDAGLVTDLIGPAATVTPGTAPYTYAWTKLGGSSAGIALTTANGPTLGFSSNGRNTTLYAAVRCTVTDAAGNTGYADANITTTHARDITYRDLVNA